MTDRDPPSPPAAPAADPRPAVAAHAALGQPSPWLVRWRHLIRPAGTVLDLACGSGRHVRWLASAGHAVTGVDRDAAAVEPLRQIARIVVADVEGGPWPLEGERFDAVIVTHYLWRPLWPRILASIAPGGVLLYETFAQGNETVGKPSRPDFLLQPGELLRSVGGLRIVAFEDGFLEAPPRFIQRIAARHEAPTPSAQPPRHPLEPGEAR
ncbi:MAG: class I SAM-dependent methyltransferase [Rubrivivax sp.]|nr:class I SAM-dependent methyltransferase [Rubrivivax sp.]